MRKLLKISTIYISLMFKTDTCLESYVDFTQTILAA